MTLKQKTYNHLLQIIDEKIHLFHHELNELAISISNETKSSAGDKYETSRAMLQIEQSQLNKQLANAIDQKTLLGSININIKNEYINTGSLINTSNGYFFLSIGLGKIEINGISIITLSLISPLGQKLVGLKVNDVFNFKNLNYIIKNIE